MIFLNAAHTQVKDVFVKTGGSWAALRGVWHNVSGTWKLSLLPFIAPDATSVTFNSNGTLSYTGPNVAPLAWYSPTGSGGSVGIGSSFWIKVAKISGTGHANIDDGGWHSLASNLTVSNIAGAGGSLSNLFIAADSSGVKVIGTGTIRVNNSA
jgi:hypothetical protein